LELPELHVRILAREHGGYDGHEGRGRRPVKIHGEGMPDHRDALCRQCLHRGLQGVNVRFGKQLSGEDIGVANVEIFLSPIPDLPPSNLPGRRREIKRRSTGSTLQKSSRGEEVVVAAGKSELAYIHRQSESDVKRKQVLQSVAITFNFENRLVKIGDCANLVPGMLRCLLRKISRNCIYGEILGQRQLGGEKWQEIAFGLK